MWLGTYHAPNGLLKIADFSSNTTNTFVMFQPQHGEWISAMFAAFAWQRITSIGFVGVATRA